MSVEREHVRLGVVGARAGTTEPVDVEPVGTGVYRVLRSPGLVEGIAAGDVIRVTNPLLGLFEVLTRGENLAVKVASPRELDFILTRISAWLGSLGGRLDGAIDVAGVWTVPVSAGQRDGACGFHRIERAMGAALAEFVEVEWWYGNVYDERGEALRWWQDRVVPAAEEIVRARWNEMPALVERDYPHLLELIGVANSLPKVRTLFPFVSIGRLCLSRCTSFPYYVDFLVSMRGTNFRAEVTLEPGGWVHTKQVGEGSASLVGDMIESLIPSDYGGARLGDADLPCDAAPKGAAPALARFALLERLLSNSGLQGRFSQPLTPGARG
jgi:hypothetical protein